MQCPRPKRHFVEGSVLHYGQLGSGSHLHRPCHGIRRLCQDCIKAFLEGNTSCISKGHGGDLCITERQQGGWDLKGALPTLVLPLLTVGARWPEPKPSPDLTGKQNKTTLILGKGQRGLWIPVSTLCSRSHAQASVHVTPWCLLVDSPPPPGLIH